MLTRRIIPCLDVRDGQTVKGVNFVDLRQAGDPVALGERYAAEGADELCEVLEAQSVGFRVDSPHHRQVQLVEQCGHGVVGLDHKHLNDSVRVAVIGRVGVNYLAGLVEYELRLGQVQMQHAGGPSSLLYGTAQALHILQKLDNLLVCAFCVAFENPVGLLVRKSLLGQYYRVGKSAGHDIAIVVVRDICCFAEAFLLGLKAANAVAEINPASPSKPSVKLTALENPTMMMVAMGIYQPPRESGSG